MVTQSVFKFIFMSSGHHHTTLSTSFFSGRFFVYVRNWGFGKPIAKWHRWSRVFANQNLVFQYLPNICPISCFTLHCIMTTLFHQAFHTLSLSSPAPNFSSACLLSGILIKRKLWNWEIVSKFEGFHYGSSISNFEMRSTMKCRARVSSRHCLVDTVYIEIDWGLSFEWR